MSYNDFPFSSNSEISSCHESYSGETSYQKSKLLSVIEEDEFENFLSQKNGALAPIKIEHVSKENVVIEGTLNVKIKISFGCY